MSIFGKEERKHNLWIWLFEKRIKSTNNKINQKTKNMYIFSFEKLEVWVEAKEFSKLIFKTTSKFPETEKFGLI